MKWETLLKVFKKYDLSIKILHKKFLSKLDQTSIIYADVFISKRGKL